MKLEARLDLCLVERIWKPRELSAGMELEGAKPLETWLKKNGVGRRLTSSVLGMELEATRAS